MIRSFSCGSFIYLVFSIVAVFASEQSTFKPFSQKLTKALSQEQAKLQQLKETDQKIQRELKENQRREKEVVAQLSQIEYDLKQLRNPPNKQIQKGRLHYQDFQKRVQRLYSAYLLTKSQSSAESRLQHQLINRLLKSDLQALVASQRFEHSTILPKLMSLNYQKEKQLRNEKQEKKQQLFVVRQTMVEHQKFLRKTPSQIELLQQNIKDIKKQLQIAQRLITKAGQPINLKKMPKPVQSQTKIQFLKASHLSKKYQGVVFKSQSIMKIKAISRW